MKRICVILIYQLGISPCDYLLMHACMYDEHLAKCPFFFLIIVSRWFHGDILLFLSSVLWRLWQFYLIIGIILYFIRFTVKEFQTHNIKHCTEGSPVLFHGPNATKRKGTPLQIAIGLKPCEPNPSISSVMHKITQQYNTNKYTCDIKLKSTLFFFS